MKNPYTAQSRFKTEIFLSLLTLILIAAMCLAFQHHVVKKLALSKAEVHPVHHIIVTGKPMTASEKLAFDREPQPIISEELTDKTKVRGD